jgi:hypothetical protein
MPIVSERDLDGRINCLIGNLIDETRGLRPEVSRVAMFTLIHEWISAQWFAIKSRDDHPKILTLLALVELEAALQFLVLRHDFHELQCHIDRIDETLNEVTRRVQQWRDSGEVERCRASQS